MMLDARLMAAAGLVRRGSPVCDVGTDHGKLAAYLVLEGITGQVTAADIHQGPLEAAEKTLRACGIEDRVRLVCSDGLSKIPPEQAKDIVICGMGGELIAEIVLRCGYTRKAEVRLILQPMTQAGYLRKTLCEAGFRLLEEIPVTAQRHCYTVMHWQYDGTVRTCSPLFEAVGAVPQSAAPEAEDYLMLQQGRAIRAAQGLERSGRCPEEAAARQKLAREIAGLLARWREEHTDF